VLSGLVKKKPDIGGIHGIKLQGKPQKSLTYFLHMIACCLQEQALLKLM
jgi:hypothetical protein